MLLKPSLRDEVEKKFTKLPGLQRSTVEDIARGAGEVAGFVIPASKVSKTLGNLGSKILSKGGRALGEFAGLATFTAAQALPKEEEERIEREVAPEDRPTAKVVSHLEQGVRGAALLPFFRVAEALGGKFASKAAQVSREMGMRKLWPIPGMLGFTGAQAALFPAAGDVGNLALEGAKKGLEQIPQVEKWMERGIIARPQFRSSIVEMWRGLVSDDPTQLRQGWEELKRTYEGGFAGWFLLNILRAAKMASGRRTRPVIEDLAEQAPPPPKNLLPAPEGPRKPPGTALALPAEAGGKPAEAGPTPESPEAITEVVAKVQEALRQEVAGTAEKEAAARPVQKVVEATALPEEQAKAAIREDIALRGTPFEAPEGPSSVAGARTRLEEAEKQLPQESLSPGQQATMLDVLEARRTALDYLEVSLRPGTRTELAQQAELLARANIQHAERLEKWVRSGMEGEAPAYMEPTAEMVREAQQRSVTREVEQQKLAEQAASKFAAKALTPEGRAERTQQQIARATETVPRQLTYEEWNKALEGTQRESAQLLSEVLSRADARLVRELDQKTGEMTIQRPDGETMALRLGRSMGKSGITQLATWAGWDPGDVKRAIEAVSGRFTTKKSIKEFLAALPALPRRSAQAGPEARLREGESGAELTNIFERMAEQQQQLELTRGPAKHVIRIKGVQRRGDEAAAPVASIEYVDPVSSTVTSALVSTQELRGVLAEAKVAPVSGPPSPEAVAPEIQKVVAEFLAEKPTERFKIASKALNTIAKTSLANAIDSSGLGAPLESFSVSEDTLKSLRNLPGLGGVSDPVVRETLHKLDQQAAALYPKAGNSLVADQEDPGYEHLKKYRNQPHRYRAEYIYSHLTREHVNPVIVQKADSLGGLVQQLRGELHSVLERVARGEDPSLFQAWVETNQLYLEGPASVAMRWYGPGTEFLREYVQALYGWNGPITVTQRGAADIRALAAMGTYMAGIAMGTLQYGPTGGVAMAVLPPLIGLFSPMRTPILRFVDQARRWLRGSVMEGQLVIGHAKEQIERLPTAQLTWLYDFRAGDVQYGFSFALPEHEFGKYGSRISYGMQQAGQANKNAYDQWFNVKRGTLLDENGKLIEKGSADDKRLVRVVEQMSVNGAEYQKLKQEAASGDKHAQRLLEIAEAWRQFRDDMREQIIKHGHATYRLEKVERDIGIRLRPLHTQLQSLMRERADSLAAMQSDQHLVKMDQQLRNLRSAITITKKSGNTARLKPLQAAAGKVYSFLASEMRKLGHRYHGDVASHIRGVKRSATILEWQLKNVQDRLANYRASWGLKDYLPHIVDMEAQPLIGLDNSMMPAASIHDLLSHIGNRNLRHRTGKLEESGKRLESFVQAVAYYTQTMPGYIERMKTLRDIMPELEGNLLPIPARELFRAESGRQYIYEYKDVRILGRYRRHAVRTVDSNGIMRIRYELREADRPSPARQAARMQAKRRMRATGELGELHPGDADVIVMWAGAKDENSMASLHGGLKNFNQSWIQARIQDGTLVTPTLRDAAAKTFRYQGGFLEALQSISSGRYDLLVRYIRRFQTGFREDQWDYDQVKAQAKGLVTWMQRSQRWFRRIFLPKTLRTLTAASSAAMMGGPVNLESAQTVGLSGVLMNYAGLGPVLASRGMWLLTRWAPALTWAKIQFARGKTGRKPRVLDGSWDPGFSELFKPSAKALKKNPDLQLEWEALRGMFEDGVLQARKDVIPQVYEWKEGQIVNWKDPVPTGRTITSARWLFNRLVWSWIELADFTTRVPVYTQTYLQARKQFGYDDKLARRLAFQATHDLQRIWNPGNRPLVLNTAAGQLATNMNTWVITQLIEFKRNPQFFASYALWFYFAVKAASMAGVDITRMAGSWVGDVPVIGRSAQQFLLGIGEKTPEDPVGTQIKPGQLVRATQKLVGDPRAADFALPMPMFQLLSPPMKPVVDVVKGFQQLYDGNTTKAGESFRRALANLHPYEVRQWLQVTNMEPIPGTGFWMKHSRMTGKGTVTVPWDPSMQAWLNLMPGQLLWETMEMQQQGAQQLSAEYLRGKQQEYSARGRDIYRDVIRSVQAAERAGRPATLQDLPEAQRNLFLERIAAHQKFGRELGKTQGQIVQDLMSFAKAAREESADWRYRSMVSDSIPKQARMNSIMAAMVDPGYGGVVLTPELLRRVYQQNTPADRKGATMLDWIADQPQGMIQQFLEAERIWRSFHPEASDQDVSFLISGGKR